MKRIVTLIASGALLLTSCADKQGDEPRQDTSAIGFTTSVSRSTAGPVSGFVDGDAFSVWAQMKLTGGTGTPVSIFNAEKVTYDGSAWSYANTRYWELAGYDFAAVYPAEVAGASVAYAEDGTPVFRIENYNATANYDLMTATTTATYTGGTPSPVAFTFRHIMSNIVFVARTAPALAQQGVTMTITSFRLTGFPVTGSYDSSRTPAWSVSTPENERYNSTDEILLEGTEYAPVADLIVFPQELGTAAGSSLRYEISYKSSGGDEYTRSGRLQTVSGNLARWEPGRRYRYTVELGGDYILFGTPEVDEWSEISGGRWNVE